MANTITISNARRRIFDLAKSVQTPGAYYTLTENGLPKVVMMSAEEFESWQETLEVMAEFPNLKDDVRAAERALKRGNYLTLDQVMAKYGLSKQRAGVSPTKYAVPRRRSATRTKRSR